jgi:hypothetical protein
MRALKGFGVIAAAFLCSLAAAQQDKVKIIAPEAGATVRGVVEVVADKPGAKEGTYAWKIARAGKEAEGEFQANTLAGLAFLWDTRVRNEKGERIYPDGEYVVTANGFDGTGEFQGSATVKIRIENDIAPAEVADGVKLQVNLKTADVLNYEFNGDEKISVDMTATQGAEAPPFVIQTLLTGGYNLKMLSGAGSGGGGLCRETCTNGAVYPQTQGMRPYYVDDMGKSFTQDYLGDGVIKPNKTKDPHFDLGEVYIQLPSRVLTMGARPWKSDMSVVLELFSLRRQVVAAEHRLDGFEWVQGEKCARLKSQFSEPNIEFDVTVNGQAYKVKGTISGTRVTYFAYEAGYPVSIEDTLHHELELEPKQQAAGMGMGMGAGAEMGGGMAGGPMMGGGMMPGGGMAEIPGMGGGVGVRGPEGGGMMPGGGMMGGPMMGGGMMPGGGMMGGPMMGGGMMPGGGGGMMPGGGMMGGGSMMGGPMMGGGMMPGGGGGMMPGGGMMRPGAGSMMGGSMMGGPMMGGGMMPGGGMGGEAAMGAGMGGGGGMMGGGAGAAPQKIKANFDIVLTYGVVK